MKKMLSLREIQEIELDILINFREICSKLGLRYYLSGGTLLGAVRHKGFIPWDDDIDLAMPRDDFNKLLEYSLKYSSDTYEFIFYSDEGMQLPYGKFVNKNTRINSKYADGEMQKHLWLDIMPMDGLPLDHKKTSLIYKKAKYYRRIIGFCYAKLGKDDNLIKKIGKYIFKPLALMYGKNRAINKLNQLAMKYSYNDSEYVGAITWGLYGVAEKIDKNAIGEGVDVIFENESFKTFCCWDTYLKNLYRDYMKLPPVEKRINHHVDAWIELD